VDALASGAIVLAGVISMPTSPVFEARIRGSDALLVALHMVTKGQATPHDKSEFLWG
jgi:hypothetical protein